MLQNYRSLVGTIVLLIVLMDCKAAYLKKENSIVSVNAIDTVPFLNRQWEENYFIGNGILGGGGDSKGIWNFLIGPDYTSPNFLKSEVVTINLNGEFRSLSFAMHRIKSSGIYYGIVVMKEANIHVFDYVVPNKPLIIRHFVVENKSVNQPLTVQIKAEITKGKGIFENVIGNNSALLLKANPQTPLFGNGDGGFWKESFALIAFNTKSKCTVTGDVSTFTTEKISVDAKQKKQVALVHFLFDDNQNSADKNLAEIQSINLKDNFDKTKSEWWAWIAKGEKFDSENVRVKDILESMLVGIRMQQNRCGGFIAGTRKYAFSYIRDSFGACKGLLACGHTDDVKKYLEITIHKFRLFKKIPNSVQMGADQFSHGDGNQYAESPAYVILLAKEYYEATKDINFLKSMDDLLTYAINIQIEYAKVNNWLLPFNGDETEQYCLKEDGKEYGGFPALTGFNSNQWSMSSVAACIASLDFYIDYLKLKKMDSYINDYQEAMGLMKESIVKHFYRSDLASLQWALKKDNTFYPYNVTNFALMPVWFGVSLKDNVEKATVEKALSYRNPQTGFIANAPGDVEGFCGHTLAYMLYDLTQLNMPEKDAVYNTLINSCIIQRYGMVNEYYGPNGIPNPHNQRVFESGIVIDAIVNYLKNKSLQDSLLSNLKKDNLPSLKFKGTSTAELYTREIEESFKGVLKYNFIGVPTKDYPMGFLRASPEPQGWNTTFWTRDGGTFLRELVHWGMLEHASTVVDCLIHLVEKNEEGYYSFPEYFQKSEKAHGKELDGTSAIIIGMVDLWRALPKNSPSRNKIYSFLHGPDSPLQYIHHKLNQVTLLEGEGEFGPGCGLKGAAVNVVQNNLCRLALIAGSKIEEANNDISTASIYAADADKIKTNMLKYLVALDKSWIWCVNPVTLIPDSSILNDPINKGAGLINGVACMSSDVLGFIPLESDKELNNCNMNTFHKLYNTPLRKEQFDKYGLWPQFDVYRAGLSSGPSYGDGYALQTMLLYDNMSMADKSIQWIANSTYQPINEYKIKRNSPYYFYERSYSPDAVGKVELEAGCGALNLVNVTEQLKIARLIVGVDDKDADELLLVPRVPPSWSGYTVTDWVIITEDGIAKADISYIKEGNIINFKIAIKGDQKFKKIALRLPYKGGWKWYYKENSSTFNVCLKG
jgi:GH15 family glucan-1,4-alpha-glucosidase